MKMIPDLYGLRLARIAVVVLLLAGCASASDSGLITPEAPVPQASTPTFTSGATPTPLAATTPTLTPAALPSPSPTLQAQICSPLGGVARSQLSDMIHNPFHPPRAGSDDPHQGVDFADLQGPDRIAVSGRPVTAVLGGRVAMVTADRFPYGNAVLIETPLEDLPAAWLDALALPQELNPHANRSALTCPAQISPPGDLSGRSLYLLYAHMLAPPGMQSGHAVTCGEALGAIGSSGNALNPHLHLEVRLGPANAGFASMAHYDTSATPEEMAAYCTWRISGYFRLVDPLRLFSLP
jgi:murein DD-endopeptidase MepM/ murein hydrolase activator NlpD